MCNSDRRHFLAMSLLTVGAVCIGGAALAAEPAPKKVYVCPPCGCAADGKEFPEPGTCPECGMPLVEKKPEPAKPPGASQGGGAQGGGLLAKQTRAPSRPASAPRTGKPKAVSGQWGFLS
jgi:hypothetical protein